MITQECAKVLKKRMEISNHFPSRGTEQGAFVCAHNLFITLTLALMVCIFY